MIRLISIARAMFERPRIGRPGNTCGLLAALVMLAAQDGDGGVRQRDLMLAAHLHPAPVGWSTWRSRSSPHPNVMPSVSLVRAQVRMVICSARDATLSISASLAMRAGN